MAQGLGRETKEQAQGKECNDKTALVKSVRCSDGKVMGSRRIFAPQFKLQVLDSYRKDEDCKGNQRATARKYGIHRRQIQKWLQVEASLRTSVEVSPASEPTALNLSADAARQRDDSGESRQAACQRSGEERPQPPSARSEHTQLVVKLEVSENLHELDVKEEQVYEDNMEVPSSMHNSDEALDFTCAALSKRRSFSLQFKLEVLDAFHADRMCHGNQRATARKFGINRRQVQKWLGQEVELRGEASFRGGLYRQRLGRWMELDSESKRTEENVPTIDPGEYDSVSNDQCWDLSGKKRKFEEETIIDTGYNKRRAVEQTILQSREGEMNENTDVSSSSASARDVLYNDVQETALCLVKVKTEERPEVTSSVDTSPRYESFSVPPSFHPHHMIPLVLPPPSFDLYAGVHCRHHYMHHLQAPKWFRREPELCQDITNIRAFNMFR